MTPSGNTTSMHAHTWDVVITVSFFFAFPSFGRLSGLHKVLQVGQCFCSRLDGQGGDTGRKEGTHNTIKAFECDWILETTQQ